MSTGTRTRTRQAILDAAIELLAQHPAASLGEIAAAARVGRTTLHRYFPDRSDLLTAVGAEGRERLSRATLRADVARDTGGAALLRLAREYFDLGSVLSLIFAGSGDAGCVEPAEDQVIAGLVTRGHADGSIDPELPAGWLENLFWSQMYAAWAHLGDNPDMSRHEVLHLLLRSLGNALRPA